jgi:acyl carrier protein
MKPSLLELTNQFLLTKDKGPVNSKTDDLFDYMDSLDYLEFILYLEQHNIKIMLPIHNVHFNFNLIETIERLERYIEEKEYNQKSLLTFVNQWMKINNKEPVSDDTKLFSSGLIEFNDLASYLEVEAGIILPAEYENKLEEVDMTKQLEKIARQKKNL